MRIRDSESERYEQALDALFDRTRGFYSAPWLKSPFESHVWHIVIGGHKSVIDFRVKLDDGTLLVDSRHSELLRALKCFLLLQTHLDVTGGIVYSSASMNSRVMIGTHICEYFLINSQELGLAKFGLGAITESDGYRMLKRLAHFDASDGIYRWSERLAHHLKVAGNSLDEATVAQTLFEIPELSRVCESDMLGLDFVELLRARVWLWVNGYYKFSHYDDGHMFTVDSNKLMPILYPRGTLKTSWKKSHIPELHVFRGPCLIREKPGAPVRGAQRCENPLRYYVKAIGTLVHLKRLDLTVPHELVRATSNRTFIKQLDLQPLGRYATLPHDVVLKALADALEFSLKYGDEILNAYVEVSRCAAAQGVSVGTFLSTRPIERFLGPNLSALGTNCWSVALQVKQQFCRGRKGIPASDAEREFFQRFRLGHGLFELLYVLGGAILIVVGTLMARRQGELIDLKAGAFLDESGSRLVFDGRKSGTQDIRQRLVRPIPPVAVDLLLSLENFQDRLVTLGIIKHRTNLFSLPKLHRHDLSSVSDSRCNMMLDRFCDFIELPNNSLGQRYYIRQHQLRRFFAMLFFWGNSFSGLDTLRWFLGQTDAEHLYHYISESTPGWVLRSVKVDYAVERTKVGDPQTLPLLDLLEERFGTRNVLILDAEELGDYMEELMIEGRVSVEPHFIQGLEGREYRIMITVAQIDTVL